MNEQSNQASCERIVAKLNADGAKIALKYSVGGPVQLIVDGTGQVLFERSKWYAMKRMLVAVGVGFRLGQKNPPDPEAKLKLGEGIDLKTTTPAQIRSHCHAVIQQ